MGQTEFLLVVSRLQDWLHWDRGQLDKDVPDGGGCDGEKRHFGEILLI